MNEELKNEFWSLMDKLYEFTKRDEGYYHGVTSKGEEILFFVEKALKHVEQEKYILERQIQSKENIISELQENAYFMENTIKTLQNDNKILANRSNLDEIKRIVFD